MPRPWPVLILLCAGWLAMPAAFAMEVEIVTGEIPPYTMEIGGKPKGVVAEIVQAMAKKVGHSGRLTFLPWKRALKVAEEGAAGIPTLIIPLNRSPEREKRFKWITRLLVDDTVLVTKKGARPRVDNPEMAKSWRVGALLGSPLEAQLREMGFTGVDPGVDEEASARKLNLGRLDAWLVARMVAPYVYGTLGMDPSELQYGVTLRPNDLHLGATLSLPEPEAAKWRAALEAVKKDGTYDEIISRYLPKDPLEALNTR